MPAFCGVIGCSNKRSKFPEKSYFRLPAIDKRYGGRREDITLIRRKKWLANLARASLSETTKKNLLVCSDHFLSGRPADLEATSHPDWAPTQNLGHSKLSQKMMAINSARYKRIQDKVEKRDVFMAAEAVMNMQQNTQPGSDEAFFKEPLEIEEWEEEQEQEEEGDEEEEEGVGHKEGGRDWGLLEFLDPLQRNEESTDVSRETSNCTQKWKQRAKLLAAKINQKGSLVSIGQPSCNPSLVQANPINKGGVKLSSRPDDNPAPVPPVPTMQATAHRHPGQKVFKFRRKRCQLQELPDTTASRRFDVCNSPHATQSSLCMSVPTLGKKCQKVNQKSPKDSTINSATTATAKRKFGEYTHPCLTPFFPTPHIPISGKKYHKLEEDLDFYILKGWQNETSIEEGNTEATEAAVDSKDVTSEAEDQVKQEKLPIEEKSDSAMASKRGSNKTEDKVNQEQLQSEESQYANSWETESVDSPTNDSLTAVIDDSDSSIINHQETRPHEHVQTPIVTYGKCYSTSSHQTSSSDEHHLPISAQDKYYFTLNDIFRDLFIDSFTCPYCPLSLAKAVVSVMHKQLTQEQASVLYCVCSPRLRMCLSSVSKLQTMYDKNIKDLGLLEEMRKYAPYDAVAEWLLRMRRMGRFPVMADVNQVANYLGNNVLNVIGSMKYFIRIYGQQIMSLEEWVFPTPIDSSKWHTHLREHLNVCCGMKPDELLTSKNDLQVFTSAEVLVSLGDFPNEIIISRGKSNLYCLTQRNTGVYRAILTFSAAGQFHPPTILQKGYDLPQWALNEESVDLMASPDGKLDPLVFLGWLRRFEQRLTEAGVPRPVVLFVHGHAAHGSPAVDSFCCSKGIILHSHHYSPINLMDIHLLSPLLYHLNHTQEQMTTLTDTHPLPDYLLPSILADAWSQVSQEKLAEKAFRRSGLVPYEHSKSLVFDKFIQIATFPSLLLEYFKTYFTSSDLPDEDPFESEPQMFTTYHLRTLSLSEKFQCTVKKGEKDSAYDIFSLHKLEEREEVITDHSDQTCDPLYVGPDELSDPSITESESVIHVHGDMTNAESSIDNSPENDPEQVSDELPLICKIEDPVNWSESSLSPHQHIESDLTSDPIHVESSIGNLLDCQPHVIGYPEFICNSTAYHMSSIQDQPDCDIKVEQISPIDNIWIKEEMKEPTGSCKLRSKSEEDN